MLTNKNTPGSRFFHLWRLLQGQIPLLVFNIPKKFRLRRILQVQIPLLWLNIPPFFACGAFYKGKSPYYHSIYIFSPAALLVPLLSLNTPIFSHYRRNILGISSDNNVVYPCKMRRANPLIVLNTSILFSPAAPPKAIPYCIVSF